LGQGDSFTNMPTGPLTNLLPIHPCLDNPLPVCHAESQHDMGVLSEQAPDLAALAAAALSSVLAAFARDLEKKVVFSNESDGWRLSQSTFHALTLRRATRETQRYEVHEEVQQLSGGGLEFRACINPGHGFCRGGGLWKEQCDDDFLKDCLVFFIAGFNDQYSCRNQVYTKIGEHIEWFKWYQNTKLVFIEVDDGHRTTVPWVSDFLHAYAAKDPDRVYVLKLPFPNWGWASEGNDEDTWHLTMDSLLKWLRTTVREEAARLAAAFRLRRVLFITDSTFQAHQYERSENSPTSSTHSSIVTIRHLGNETKLKIEVGPTDVVRDLKRKIVEMEFPVPGASPGDLTLMHPDGQLNDEQGLSSCRINQNSGILVLLNPGEKYSVNKQFLRQIPLRVISDYMCPPSAPGVYFYGVGLFRGDSLADNGYLQSRGRDGIYCTPHCETAFRYAGFFKYEGQMYLGPVFINRVTPTAKEEIGAERFCIVRDERDIRWTGMLVLENPTLAVMGSDVSSGSLPSVGRNSLWDQTSRQLVHYCRGLRRDALFLELLHVARQEVDGTLTAQFVREILNTEAHRDGRPRFELQHNGAEDSFRASPSSRKRHESRLYISKLLVTHCRAALRTQSHQEWRGWFRFEELVAVARQNISDLPDHSILKVLTEERHSDGRPRFEQYWQGSETWYRATQSSSRQA